MRTSCKNLQTILMGLALSVVIFACTKDDLSTDFTFLDLQPINFEEVEPVIPDFVWTQEIAGSPGGYEWHVQDYEVSLSLNSWPSEAMGTQYGATIILCNNGVKAIDTFQLDFTYKGSVIYSTWFKAFTGACQIFYFSKFYQGAGTYEVKIRLPAAHHDHNTGNNKMSKSI